METLSGNSKLGILGRSNVNSSAINGGAWSALESGIDESVARGSSTGIFTIWKIFSLLKAIEINYVFPLVYLFCVVFQFLSLGCYLSIFFRKTKSEEAKKRTSLY